MKTAIAMMKRIQAVLEGGDLLCEVTSVSMMRVAIADCEKREEALASLKLCSTEMDKINNHLDATIADCEKQQTAQSTSTARPDAWKIPHLQTFKNAERVHFSRAPGCTLSDAELMALMEGTVMWTVHMWCDGLSVTDRNGVVHAPRPLFERALGGDLNEWKEAMMQGLCDAAMDSPVDMAPLDILNRIIDMRVTMAQDPAISPPGANHVADARRLASSGERGELLAESPEINQFNYAHDDVVALNEWCIRAYGVLEADQGSDANAPWLSIAHLICTDAGIAQGHIRWRMDALRDKLAAASSSPATGVYPELLSEFKEGQWWVTELDQMHLTATDDQKRAIAVVHHLLLSVRRATEVKSLGDVAG